MTVPNAVRGAALVAGVVCLAACKTTPQKPIHAAVTDYLPASGACAASVDTAPAVSFSGAEPKAFKKAQRERTVTLSETLGPESPCLDSDGEPRPYAVFEIPRLMEGGVVYAGGLVERRRLVVPQIATLDANGDIVRRFAPGDHRRFMDRYGQVFSPRAEERFVLIAADPDSVGAAQSTVETTTRNIHRSGYGPTGAGGGNDILAIQNDYNRVNSYEGEVGIRVVYPKP